jgi:hypothetical protein
MDLVYRPGCPFAGCPCSKSVRDTAAISKGHCLGRTVAMAACNMGILDRQASANIIPHLISSQLLLSNKIFALKSEQVYIDGIFSLILT